MSFQKGDRVEWSYTHFLNSKSKTIITKIGTFIRTVKPKRKHLADRAYRQQGIVQFDKNKKPSTVFLIDLKEVTKHE